MTSTPEEFAVQIGYAANQGAPSGDLERLIRERDEAIRRQNLRQLTQRVDPKTNQGWSHAFAFLKELEAQTEFAHLEDIDIVLSQLDKRIEQNLEVEE